MVAEDRSHTVDALVKGCRYTLAVLGQDHNGEFEPDPLKWNVPGGRYDRTKIALRWQVEISGTQWSAIVKARCKEVKTKKIPFPEGWGPAEKITAARSSLNASRQYPTHNYATPHFVQ